MSQVESPAHSFDLYGWKPDPTLSDDENYMDIVFLITRNRSRDLGQQGHMGCLIVRQSNESNGNQSTDEQSHSDKIYQGILGAATNTPLFGTKECTSDIRKFLLYNPGVRSIDETVMNIKKNVSFFFKMKDAEIVALGQACRASQSTESCTAYITIP